MKLLTLILVALCAHSQDATKILPPFQVVGPPVMVTPDVTLFTNASSYVFSGPAFATDWPIESALNIATSDGGRAVLTQDGSITYLDGATPDSTIKALVAMVQNQSKQIGELYGSTVSKERFNACIKGWQDTVDYLQSFSKKITADLAAKKDTKNK